MEGHTEFAASRFLTKEGKVHYAQQWEELARMLNALSNGQQKTVKQWQTVWRDLKSNTSKKAAKIRNERNRTGNFPVTSDPLDTLEQRVIGVMGLDYVQGSSDVPDSVPEEEEFQLQLENGNEDILNMPPSTTSISQIFDDTPSEMGNNMDVCVSGTPQERIVINDNTDDELSYGEVLQNLNRNPVGRGAPNNSTENRKRKGRTETTERSSNPKKKQRIGVQLQEARANFTSIAENHAKSLQLSAEAAMLQAENDRKRITLEERRLAIEENKLKIDEQLIAVINNLQVFVDKFVFQ